MIMWDIGQRAREREQWEIGRHVLYVIAFIHLFVALVVFQRGFYAYHIRPTAYEVVEVGIVREETEIVTVPGARGSYQDTEIPIYRAWVEYEVQGVKFCKSVLREKREKQGDNIRIAVNKEEPWEIMRPDFLNFSSRYVASNVFWGLILLITTVIDMIRGYKERKKGYVIRITTSDSDWEKNKDV